MTPALGSRETHISYDLSGFLCDVVESWEMGSVIKGRYMQMLRELLTLRKIIQPSLEYRNPFNRVQAMVVLLRMGETALLRRLWVRHCCNQF